MQLVIKTRGATAYIPVKDAKDAEITLETLLKIVRDEEFSVKMVGDTEAAVEGNKVALSTLIPRGAT